jgi:23S rRNA pseudouridine2605 synthase
VNGQIVTELGSKADPEADHIKVDGKLLHGPERHIYLALNKPRGYVTTVTDPEGRPTVMDLVKHVGERIYPIGRLDFNSEGLLLLTNDGGLADFLTRAGSHVPKTYLVKVAGQPQEEDVEKLRHGIRIGNKPGESGPRSVRTAPAEVRLLREADNPWYEVTLIEGKNRQIRRMFEAIGHHVEKIKRVSYGSLKLDLELGKFRELTGQEISALRRPPKERKGEGEQPAAKLHAQHIGKAALKKAPFKKSNRRFGSNGRERFRQEGRERQGAGEERREFRPARKSGDARRGAFARDDRKPTRREEPSRESFADRGRPRFQDREQERREFRGGKKFGSQPVRRRPGREDRPDRQERESGERSSREFPGRSRRPDESGPSSRRGEREQGERREFSTRRSGGFGGQRGASGRHGKPAREKGPRGQGRPRGRFRP